VFGAEAAGTRPRWCALLAWPGAAVLLSSSFRAPQFSACVFNLPARASRKFTRRYPDYFQRTEDVHSHNTRNKAELYVGACSLQISRMNPAMCVPTLYNALPEEIRAILGNKRYVSALKKFTNANSDEFCYPFPRTNLQITFCAFPIFFSFSIGMF
jgi:hypothetical protein